LAWFSIVAVLSGRRWSQIEPAIVYAITVNVINQIRWPSTRHPEERQAMRFVLIAQDPDVAISLSFDPTRNVS
jgi:hypothetical protein